MSTRKKIPLIDTTADLSVTGTVSITGTGSAVITFPSATSTLATTADLAGYSPTTHNHTGIYAPVLGTDDNYVTDAEKASLHLHSNKTVLDNTTASFTTTDETKLDGIATGAEVNVNADWSAASGDAQILNKPTVMIYKGVYDAGVTYSVNDVVYYGTFYHIALNTTIGNTPSVDGGGSSYWRNISKYSLNTTSLLIQSSSADSDKVISSNNYPSGLNGFNLHYAPTDTDNYMTINNATGLVKLKSLQTSGNIELGNASDTTLSRVSAGVVAIEGVKIPAIAPGASGNVMTSNGSDWISATPPSTVPIGCGMDYYGTTEPTNWLFSYGQAISRTTYSVLFSILGTTFGTGDGSTTFNLPDKRGRASAGKDDMGGTSANRLTGLTGGIDGDVLGATGGEETHTLLLTESPAHTHYFELSAPGVRNDAIQVNVAGVGVGGFGRTTTSAGGGLAHNNVQPTIICNYIIKAL